LKNSQTQHLRKDFRKKPTSQTSKQPQHSSARLAIRKDFSRPSISRIRLQKILSQAGICSRRKAEELIEQGKVKVNNKLITQQGTRVTEKDKISVNGKIIYLGFPKVAYAFNKPKFVVSEIKKGSKSGISYGQSGQKTDTKNKQKTILDFLPLHLANIGLFNVGRLDKDTTGLIILTNDGDFANKLAHPSFEAKKIYIAEIKGTLKKHHISQLIKKGIDLEGDIQKFDSMEILGSTSGITLVRIELHSGKNRIIRRVFDSLGYEVLELSRIQVDKIILGNLKPGKLRKISLKSF